MTEHDRATSELPDGWARPRLASPLRQQRLFQQSSTDFLAHCKVSSDDVRRWHACGWLSFDPCVGDRFEEHEEWEIELVAQVSRSGLPDSLVTQYLRSLPRPLGMAPSDLALSFQFGWVTVQRSSGDPEYDDVRHLMSEYVNLYISELANEGELDELAAVRESVEAVSDAISGRTRNTPQGDSV